MRYPIQYVVPSPQKLGGPYLHPCLELFPRGLLAGCCSLVGVLG